MPKAADEDVCLGRVGRCRAMAFPQPRSGRVEHLKCWSPHLQSGSGPAGSGRPHSPWRTFGTEADAVIHALSCIGFVPVNPRLAGIWVLSDEPGTHSWNTGNNWQSWVAHESLWEEGEDSVQLSHSTLCLQCSEVGAGERGWVAASGSCEPWSPFSSAGRWLCGRGSRLGLSSELLSPGSTRHPTLPRAEGMPPCTATSASHSDFVQRHPSAQMGHSGGPRVPQGGGEAEGKRSPGPPPAAAKCAGAERQHGPRSRRERRPGRPRGCCATAPGSRSLPPPPGGRPGTAAAPGGRCAGQRGRAAGRSRGRVRGAKRRFDIPPLV